MMPSSQTTTDSDHEWRPDLVLISGGQTGADRAALDFALRAGLPHGGWCPRGRLAEDGPLDECYQLQETTSRKYAVRTFRNVRDSDATLVFSIASEPTGGTALTVAAAERLGKPVLHVARDQVESIESAARDVHEFVRQYKVHRLNIAGPRASQEPEIATFVDAVLSAWLLGT